MRDSRVRPLTRKRISELGEYWQGALYWMRDAMTAPRPAKGMTITARGLAEHALDCYFAMLEEHIPQ
jgi:hypothetical protein